MAAINEYIYNLFPVHWPPDQTLFTLLTNPGYEIAYRFFTFNLILFAMALLWGSACCIGLAKSAGEKQPGLRATAFLAIAASMGFALLITIIFLLICLKSLTANALIFSTAGISITAAMYLARNRKAIRRIITFHGNWPDTLLSLLIILGLLIYQISSVALPNISDPTSYHIPYAAFFLENRGIAAVPEHLIYPYHSLNLNILYSLGLLIQHDAIYLQTLHALFGTLTLWGLYTFCLSAGQRPFIALAAMMVFIQLFTVHNSRFAANVDLGSMYFVFFSIFSLYLWMSEKVSWLLIVAAINFGMAIGTKYLMGIFALPIALALWSSQERNLKTFLTFGAWAFLAGSWWYIRNIILTGNPVHPFATGIFGYHLWDEQDINLQFSAWPERIPISISGFLFMPYHAWKDEVLRAHGPALVITLMYASTCFAWTQRKPMNMLLLCSWIYLISWVFGTRDPRHLIPIMPIVCIYSGSVIMAGFKQIPWPAFGKTANAAFLVISAAIIGFFIQQQFIRLYYSHVGDTPEAIHEWMLHDPSYNIMYQANQIFPASATVHEFFYREGRWFFHGNLTGNAFGPHGYNRIIKLASRADGTIAPDKLEAMLKERYHAVGFIIPPIEYANYKPDEFDQYFDLKYRNKDGSIYKFRN